MEVAQVSNGWSKVYLGLWAVWAIVATGYALLGVEAQREHWWFIAASFGILELIGGLAYRDRLPMLTQVFGRYVPPELLFIVLALACWRLSQWVPDWIVWMGVSWQVVHFLKHYHSYQKYHSS